MPSPAFLPLASKSMKISKLIPALWLLPIALSSLTAAAQPGENVLKIGLIAPLSGTVANFGEDERNAITMAVEKINAEKLIPGRSISIVAEDGKCTGKEASIAAQKLISVDKVRFILGGACSGETLAMKPITEKNKVLAITAFSSHPEVTAGRDFLFRICLSDVSGAALLGGMVAKSGARSAAIISENADYSLMFDKLVGGELEKRSIKMAARETFNPGEYDFRSMLMRVKSHNPEAIILNPVSSTAAGRLVKVVRELGITTRLFGNFSYSSPETAEVAGGIGAMEGLSFVDAPAVDTPQGKAFLAEYQKRFQAPQSEWEVTARYDSVLLLAQAIAAVGADPEKVRDYFYNLPSYQGSAFTYRFDRNGDLVGVEFAEKTVKEGQIVAMTK